MSEIITNAKRNFNSWLYKNNYKEAFINGDMNVECLMYLAYMEGIRYDAEQTLNKIRGK